MTFEEKRKAINDLRNMAIPEYSSLYSSINLAIEALANYDSAKTELEPCTDVPDINDGNIYECPCGYGWDKSKVVRHHFCPNCGRAVDSTEQEPCDAVSRKEVMNMLHNHAFDYATSTKILALLKTMCGEVDRMPSVIPQYTDAEIQKMQDLESAEIQKAYELGKAEMQHCEDCISRDKAIVQLNHLLSDWDDDWNVAIRKCIETIKIVPPAAPQPKM